MKDKLPTRWRKVIVAVSGGSVILLGIIAIPAPGPGWLIIFAGLSILAKEFPWAQRALLYGRGKYKYWEQWLYRQNWYIKSAASVAAACAFIAMLWFTNIFGALNRLFSLDLDMLVSPFFK